MPVLQDDPPTTAVRRTPGPSARPAMIPVGIAALVLIAGGISAALTSSGSAQPASTHSLPTAKGATIKAVPGRSALHAIVTAGQPPADILNAVPLPKGAAVTKGSEANNTIGLYDHSLSFTAAVSEQRVIDFYRAELRALKWQLESQGPAPHGTPGYRIVGQHPGDDGYEWEIGVTVAPTTFGTGSSSTGSATTGSSTTGSASTTQTTSFTVRLFAVSDD
jgi:hypothetical protein